MGIRCYPGDSDDKESPCNAGAWVQSLGEEDALEKKMAAHPSILAMVRGAWRAAVHGVTESDTTHTDATVEYFRTSVGLLTCFNSFKKRETFFFKRKKAMFHDLTCVWLFLICRICEYHEKNYAAALETFTEGQKLNSKYYNYMLVN